MSASVPERIWTPSAELMESSTCAVLLREVGARDYNELWQWSVDHLEEFWAWVWRRYDIEADGDPSTVLDSAEMPGARWFPETQLSYPEHVISGRDPAAVALHAAGELGELVSWTWADLVDETGRIQAGLRALGVERGDRVAAYMPTVPETVAAFLAVAGLGAIWSCCSPDFGPRTVLDRFAQIEPKVLLAVDGYRYGGKEFDRREAVEAIAAALPNLGSIVRFGNLSGDGWDESVPIAVAPSTFDRLPFDHPLAVLYSSGTTGAPKAIVHGHGGLLLEHLKFWNLQQDVRPGDTAIWFATTGWVVWNVLVGALLQPTTIVLYEGNPGYPDLDVLWDLADDTGASFFGASAAYLHTCMSRRFRPRDGRALAELRAIGSTGSPLAPEAFDWVRDELGSELWLSSASGGTDVASGFVGGAPLMPVHRGELPARCLGVAVEAWNEDGVSVVDEVGELVVTKPMPSMPVGFWNDPGHSRYRAAYFEMFPGVWRHGDWIRITPRGSAVIYGRSDSTINRGGIRIGTAEIYAAALAAPSVEDALAIDIPPHDGISEGRLLLFVMLSTGGVLTSGLISDLATRIRADCSPRHVPDEVIEAPDLPRTLTGKLVEVPVRKLLMGRDPGELLDDAALANPEAWRWFVWWWKQSGRIQS